MPSGNKDALLIIYSSAIVYPIHPICADRGKSVTVVMTTREFLNPAGACPRSQRPAAASFARGAQIYI